MIQPRGGARDSLEAILAAGDTQQGHRVGSSLLAAGLALLVVGLTSAAGASRKPLHARAEIAFSVNRSGFNEIEVMAADGGGRRRLTARPPRGTDAAGSHQPAWSPDGRWIAYTSTGSAKREDERDNEIYVMNAVGGAKRRLTSNHLADWSPSWSPTGNQIAFVRAGGLGGRHAVTEIFLMRVDGSSPRLLTKERLPAFISDLAWSPDGQRIAFTRSVFDEKGEAQTAIWLVAVDGTSKRLLARDAADPAWSPDGSSVVFTSDRDRNGRCLFHDCTGNAPELYLMSSTGGAVRRLTYSKSYDVDPAWSRDGKSIVFARLANEHDDYELYIVSRDGKDVRRITSNRVWDYEPAWRPR